MPATLDDLVALFRREEDPHALATCSRAIVQTVTAGRRPTSGERPAAADHDRASAPRALVDPLAKLGAKLERLLRAEDVLVRRAAVRMAGLSGGAVRMDGLLALAQDRAPGVREDVITAIGLLEAPGVDAVLFDALGDADVAIRERAAEALLGRGGLPALERLLEYVSGEDDAEVRASVAARICEPVVDGRRALPALDAALARLGPEDPVAEAVLALKVRVLEQGGRDADLDVDAAIVAVFPTYARLSQRSGFATLGRSLRTAEALCRTTAGIPDADLSPPIALWTKALEGYLHAWLAPRLEALQRDPTKLWEHVDRLLGDAWPAYQQYLQGRWSDPVEVGGTKVEIPLRALPNVLRELQERRTKRVDQPLSVTEWARMLLLLAVDHPSGVRNVLRISRRPRSSSSASRTAS